MGNVEYKTKRMAGRWKRTVTCLLAPLLLAACAPLGRQPTVESEVIDPAGAAELYGAAALPDCENRIAYTLLGESEPAAASDAWPGESEMDWDAALRRAMTLCLYAGADAAGDWQLLYYPQALAERSGMRPFYEAYCEQDGLLLNVRFDSTTGALLWWAAEPGAGYWTRALTCGGALEAPGGTPDPALAAAAWPDYAAETAAWGETQGAALADALLQAGGRQTHAAAPAAGGGLPDSWQALYDGWACGAGDPLALCLQFEAETDGQPWQVWRVWVEPTPPPGAARRTRSPRRLHAGARRAGAAGRRGPDRRRTAAPVRRVAPQAGSAGAGAGPNDRRRRARGDAGHEKGAAGDPRRPHAQRGRARRAGDYAAGRRRLACRPAGPGRERSGGTKRRDSRIDNRLPRREGALLARFGVFGGRWWARGAGGNGGFPGRAEHKKRT